MENLPRLTVGSGVGSEVYTNVTVTSVTATHIYFSHSLGLGSARLKDLEPDMQTHFNYDPAKARLVEARQAQASDLYQRAAARNTTMQRPVLSGEMVTNAAGVRVFRTTTDTAPLLTTGSAMPLAPASTGNGRKPAQMSASTDGEIPPHAIHAKSFLDQPAPTLTVEKWLTPEPELAGKFMLVDFWATWCGPCRASIPHLNALASKFSDRLVVIGLSSETEAAVRKMTYLAITYSVAIDTQRRTSIAVQVKGIPHAMLIDPKGVVRFEGMPSYLNEQSLANLLSKYGG